MATAITRPVRREVLGGRTPLIVTLAPEGIYFREKRRRTAYLLPYGHGFLSAARLMAEQVRRAKAEARKARSAARKTGR